ncbi:YkvA family protein [Arthrobacter crystallopoietes]|uniref:DUF1232 domain-containing protein n=1 Tax=Crystallibacter crystallopoietes TaxID=37928 RepID=A0A1H0ZSX4_9MICC|nr:DUF1232 domain-containing protein [Arthrobacter crystallopoietes]AUI51834.1 hypothetical protein AC20117_14600 [Arthrobacter crystallopoietes]SDQ30361.1 Protein of unknown function [Arthrobacter crystallopoietes]
MQWWEVLAGIVGGFLLIYAALLFLLWQYARRNPETVALRDALRLLPDLLRLVHSLAKDHALPAGVRLRLLLLLVYLASPIDIVPDFIPVLGYADDVVLVALVLRSVIRAAGSEPLGRHWPGNDAGLRIIRKLAGLPSALVDEDPENP